MNLILFGKAALYLALFERFAAKGQFNFVILGPTNILSCIVHVLERRPTHLPTQNILYCHLSKTLVFRNKDSILIEKKFWSNAFSCTWWTMFFGGFFQKNQFFNFFFPYFFCWARMFLFFLILIPKKSHIFLVREIDDILT